MVLFKPLFAFLLLAMFILAACESSVKESPAKLGGQRGSCVCAQYYEPVCGADGKTYANDCVARCAGVAFQTGECKY